MVRASEDRLSSLLDLVYDASTDPQGWPLLLDSLRKATGSHVAVAYSFSRSSTRPIPAASRSWCGC
ncbi:MAG TPA: hypothetical protein VF031_07475 [Alphaproteobacteria bacterium]